MAIYTRKEIEDFRKRWEGNELLIREIIRILKWEGFKRERAQYKIVEKIESANQLLMEAGFKPMAEAVEYFADFKVPSLDLRGINLKLRHCEGMLFIAARLEGADMQMAHLEAADFRMAHLEASELQNSNLEGASFFETQLQGVNMLSAHLYGARFVNTSLAGANLTNVKFGHILKFSDECELSQENRESIKGIAKSTAFYYVEILPKWKDHLQEGVHWQRLWRHISDSWFYTNFLDVRIDDADTVMAPDLYRYVKDQQYLYRFKQTHPWIYCLWKILSDCGGKLSVVFFWAMAFVLMFAWFYPATNSIDPDSLSNLARDLPPFWRWLFVSFDIFSNLGIRNTHPQHAVGVVLMIGESLLGFMMLGMLISVLQNRFARRS